MSLSTRIRSAGTLATGAAVAGIAVLAVAGPAQAAPAIATHTAASTTSVSQAQVLASDEIINLGLTIREGQAVQGFLKARYGYAGEINGQLDTESWKAMQRELTTFGSQDDGVGVYTGPIDGIVDSDTISALQQLLAPPIAGYTGPIDGVANPQTETAFAVYADTLIEDDGL